MPTNYLFLAPRQHIRLGLGGDGGPDEPPAWDIRNVAHREYVNQAAAGEELLATTSPSAGRVAPLMLTTNDGGDAPLGEAQPRARKGEALPMRAMRNELTQGF